MATNHTQNYNLCQWEADDKVLRTEFNEDNRKIDAALGSLASSVSGKASASALSSLQTTVNGLSSSKADKTALDSLKTTVSQHTSALTRAGNCQAYTTSYTGNGQFGEANKNSITFPHKPFVVFLIRGTIAVPLFQGVPSGSKGGTGETTVNARWSGNTLSWFSSSSAVHQMNQENTTYHVIALLEL